ncbi:MAG TPA: DUF2797 domain-containing protein [Bacteroidales bacterium]|nr:DUF2797 domain-containing protein [Bacteroidales bacterium]
MIYEGNLKKMSTTHESPVKYYMTFGEEKINMNGLIGKQIRIEYSGRINCIRCNALTQKSFHQGYCYSCFISAPECDAGVLHPEKDQSHLGISRDMEWAKQNSLIDHYVYLAITGNLKVGVTRHTQIPFRWIDQGAIKAIKLAKTPYRYLAGIIEVDLKKYVSDKTNKDKMLQTKDADLDLIKLKNEIAEKLSNDLKKFISFDNTIFKINYPYDYNIKNFVSLSLDKTPTINGKLAGIKGQYLLFENGEILNVRTHNGYYVKLEIL